MNYLQVHRSTAHLGGQVQGLSQFGACGELLGQSIGFDILWTRAIGYESEANSLFGIKVFGVKEENIYQWGNLAAALTTDRNLQTSETIAAVYKMHEEQANQWLLSAFLDPSSPFLGPRNDRADVKLIFVRLHKQLCFQESLEAESDMSLVFGGVLENQNV